MQSILQKHIILAKNFEVGCSNSGGGKLSWRKLIPVELTTSKLFLHITSFIGFLLMLGTKPGICFSSSIPQSAIPT